MLVADQYGNHRIGKQDTSKSKATFQKPHVPTVGVHGFPAHMQVSVLIMHLKQILGP